MELARRRILITGAGQGLGRAVALQTAQAGAHVFVTDMNAAKVEEVVNEIRNLGGNAQGYCLNVTDLSQIAQVKKNVMESGGLDILVNNAGTVLGGDFLSVPLEVHHRMAAVNLLGLWNITHAFLPLLIQRQDACVLNVASASAILPLPHAATYAATKAAVLSFSDSLKEELILLGHSHVKVSVVCPSYISTGLFEGAAAPFLTSILTTDFVAKTLLESIQKERSFVLMPWRVWFLYAGSTLLPRNWYHKLCRWIGVSTSMQKWVGHK